MNYDNPKNSIVLTKGIKIAAYYLILAGALGIIFFLYAQIFQYPEYPQFQSQSLAYKAGAYFKQISINLLFLISGIGILKRKVWARKMALVILVIGTIYSGYDFAWGLKGSQPSVPVLLISLLIVALWNSIWFYQVYKVKLPESVQI